jgi:hypothetical protein
MNGVIQAKILPQAIPAANRLHTSGNRNNDIFLALYH